MNYTKAEITEKATDEFTAVASTETKDRHGEIVKADGWDLKNYKKNPILLFMHDHTKPIGKATKVWIDKTSKPRLMFKGVISSATEEARAAKQLMQEGILNSFSVGFIPQEMDGNEITKSELHEISLVPVPANVDAQLVAAKSLKKAGFEDDVIKKFMPEDESLEELKEKLKELESELSSVKEMTELAVKGLQHLAPQRSKQEIATERLHHSKVIARAADKLIGENVSRDKAVISAKVIKRSSEMLIRSHKGDLNGSTKRTTQKA